MKKMVLIGSLTLLLAGCGNTAEKYTSPSQHQDERVQEVERQLDNYDEIDHAHIVIIENQMLVAVQVKPWHRWKKQDIEEQVKQVVEKKFPQADLTISTDFKLHWEAGKLMEEKSAQQLKKRMKELAKLAKEEA